MITFQQKGNFKKTFNFLRYLRKFDLKDLNKYGEEGVAALMAATPVDTGETASSWYYTITEDDSGIQLNFHNSNLGDGWAPIAVLLQYGHGTGTGGWVEGRDYINPALKPIFDRIAKDAWEEVTSA